jgi:hypothetical protein
MASASPKPEASSSNSSQSPAPKSSPVPIPQKTNNDTTTNGDLRKASVGSNCSSDTQIDAPTATMDPPISPSPQTKQNWLRKKLAKLRQTFTAHEDELSNDFDYYYVNGPFSSQNRELDTL